MTRAVAQRDMIWALGSMCSLLGRPCSLELLAREFPPPSDTAMLVQAARALGLRTRQIAPASHHVAHAGLPLLVGLQTNGVEFDGLPPAAAAGNECTLGIIIAADANRVVLHSAGSDEALTLSHTEFAQRFTGQAWLMAPEVDAANDPDVVSPRVGVSGFHGTRPFGFGWFVPELLRHRDVWRDVLLASAALQLLALATPLFMQAIIDKVVVHRTQSTLIAIALAMLLFMLFSSLLTWVRQYLVLHTGNRVDAVLGAAVWEHLLRLPVRYFEHRATGVVAARLQGVDTIREFVSGAAVSLLLDLPFLVICLGVMLWYSVPLSAIALAILGVIAALSLLIAPLFQARLNEQFLLGARNQAFVTEHIAGFETVKSLQMEPQLRQRYGDYLASYLHSGFKTKQVANTYNVIANTLEQLMTLLILLAGAWLVMTPEPGGSVFTIGMLVAFQMLASKLSQPVLRIVGLWTQFQQARLSVLRLGDVMNAPAEPYGLAPQRQGAGPGRVEIADLAFRYGDDRPLLYEDLSLAIEPGKVIAIVGPSGSGKSTLAKLLLGFYRPTGGQIRIDGVDLRHLNANELRANFGVVPQETILFSGTVHANVTVGNPGATFEQVLRVCRMAGIHDTIEALPKGYQTEIGERGAGLSGGQKQRLAIARALLKGPKILIFDEATSSLDEATAEAFARTITGLRGKVTMLFIAHRIPKALRVDEVLRLGQVGVAHSLHGVAGAGAWREVAGANRPEKQPGV